MFLWVNIILLSLKNFLFLLKYLLTFFFVRYFLVYLLLRLSDVLNDKIMIYYGVARWQVQGAIYVKNILTDVNVMRYLISFYGSYKHGF